MVLSVPTLDSKSLRSGAMSFWPWYTQGPPGMINPQLMVVGGWVEEEAVKHLYIAYISGDI